MSLQIKKIHVVPEKKLTDVTKMFQISKNRYKCSLGRMHSTGDDGYQNFLAFVPMLSSLILDNNKKVINWMLTRVLPEKSKLFDTTLKPNISNLANGKVNLIPKNFILVQKKSFSLYSNFILILYLVYELNK